MIDESRILITGGSGLLGTHLKKELPNALYPTSAEFDVADFDALVAWAKKHPFDLCMHGAAFTSPPEIDKDPTRALEVNVIGTANVVRLCASRGARLVYISTDYVFPGDRGMYAEADPVNPVNKYAWSKLGGECAVRLYDDSLIVRTSFGPDSFPYPKAFSDQWTSREPVSTMAAKIATILRDAPTGVMHLGGPRRTVLEYANALDNEGPVGELSINDVNFSVPVDTSLDCSRYEQFIKDHARMGQS